MLKRIFLCLICALWISWTSGIPEAKQDNDIYSRIDKYLQACVKNARIPALSVTVVDKNSVLFSRAYGECKSTDTPFLLGSVSKSFTAVCIMQLAEQQKIDLNAYISAYLPDAVDGNAIQVRQLLNHTSGLGEHQTLENYKMINPQGVHRYANVNYTLAGKIIEAVSGQTYSEYITENLFEPLGLAHTSAVYHGNMPDGLMDGYINYGGFPVKTAHKCPISDATAWISVPAGYLSSSANDLGRYLQMYLNGGEGILSSQSIEAMLYGDTVYVDGGIPFWYGYGWAMITDPLPEAVFRHAGLVETGTSCVFMLPERGMAVAVEANINDYFVANEMMDALGWGIVQILLGEPPNHVAGSTYIGNHLWIDGILFAVLGTAVLPICFLPAYKRKWDRKPAKANCVSLILLHLAWPVGILLIAPVCFATPLWVVKAFVPDVFITIVVSSGLLFMGGIIKGMFLILRRNSKIKLLVSDFREKQ